MDEARLNLTRRFKTAREARDEAESNLSAGSLWVPLEIGAERPALLRAVIVALQLEDGTVLEGLRGRVTCLAPAGVAVVLDDLPPAVVLTRLLGGELPPPPSLSTELAPEDPPPLPAGFQDAWQPLPSAPIPAPPVFDPPPFAAPFAPLPPTPPATFDSPPAVLFDPPPAATFEVPPEIVEPPVVVAPSPEPAAAELDTLPTLKASAAPPAVEPPPLPPPASFDSPAPAAPAFDEPRSTASVSFDSPARERDLPPPPESADFPMMREPVPAVSARANMWGDDGSLDPELKVLRAPEEVESSEPPRPQFTVRFTDGISLETAWKGELGQARVLVTAADPPALDARVEVTLLLPEVGALVLEGTVVHRAGNGVGVRLDMDSTTRALIESALPSNNPPAPAPPPVALIPDAAAPRRPSMELKKDDAGRNVLVVRFDSLADFRREYETNIRRGGVMVPTTERPPVRSVIEIVFSLLAGKREVRLKAEVVLHGPTGIGVQLSEIPASTRVEIESLIAAAGGNAPTPDAPIPAPRAPAPAPAPATIVPPPPSPPAPVATSRPRTPGPGVRFSGELVEVMREAEVEGEAGVSGLASKASWLKVLAHLQSSRSNGVLKAVRKAETKSYVVVGGRLIDSKGEPPRDDESMLRVIRKNNLAKPGVLRILDRALDKAPDELKALEAANVWSAAEVDRARRWQVLERASEVFAWEKGRFEFEPDGDRSWARPSGGVAVGHVILHGVRSYLRASGEDLARILRNGLDRVLRVVPDTGFEPAKVGMSDKELKFWAELDGKKSLRAILATSPIAQSQAHRIIFALCRLGVLAFEKGSGAGYARSKDGDRTEVLKGRLADMRTRDPFGQLGISWMSAMPQVQAGWDALRRELDADVRTAGTVSETAKAILGIGEAAWRQLLDDRTRRLQRLKIIEDPSRIEAAADMLADRAELLRLQGDKAGAEAALQMAIDLAPGNGAFVQQLSRVRAG